jgi:mono/diheme cytochrome c family protein
MTFATRHLIADCVSGATSPARRRGRYGKMVVPSVLALALLGCDRQAPPQEEAVPARAFDSALLERGRVLYKENCAHCHGDRAQGAPAWHRPDPNGKWPPPPLNGSGHAWHHPRLALEKTIREGTAARGGDMPAWGDRLSDRDIDAIIAWLQQQWPKGLYEAWWRMDRQSRSDGQ